jgi:Flp pilus assembly secretin CpaC
LQQALAADDAEPAHLKTIAISDGMHAVANLVSSDTPAALSHASRSDARAADVIVNARVAIDPQILEQRVQTVVQDVCRAMGAAPLFAQTQSFRPGRPNPTYRYAEAV